MPSESSVTSVGLFTYMHGVGDSTVSGAPCGGMHSSTTTVGYDAAAVQITNIILAKLFDSVPFL